MEYKYNGEEFLRRLKEVSGITTQNGLADKLGVTQGAISKLKNSPPSGDILLRIISNVGCSIDYLMGIDNNTEKGINRKSTVYDFVRAINGANEAGAVTITDDRFNFDDKETGKSVEISGKCIRILDYNLNDAVSLALFSNRMVQYSDKYGSRILESFFEGLKKENEPIQKACADDWIKNGYKEIE